MDLEFNRSDEVSFIFLHFLLLRFFFFGGARHIPGVFGFCSLGVSCGALWHVEAQSVVTVSQVRPKRPVRSFAAMTHWTRVHQKHKTKHNFSKIITPSSYSGALSAESFFFEKIRPTYAQIRHPRSTVLMVVTHPLTALSDVRTTCRLVTTTWTR